MASPIEDDVRAQRPSKTHLLRYTSVQLMADTRAGLRPAQEQDRRR